CIVNVLEGPTEELGGEGWGPLGKF
ncbi:hypothetical protein E2320_007186, partial [Naja naja]